VAVLCGTARDDEHFPSGWVADLHPPIAAAKKAHTAFVRFLGDHRIRRRWQHVWAGGQRFPLVEKETHMVCAVERADAQGLVVLVSHNPTISVFTTTAEHLGSIPRKPDGHYDRSEVMKLVGAGHAVHYDENAVRAIAWAGNHIIFGCPPR
jgi:hypothetical protein